MEAYFAAKARLFTEFDVGRRIVVVDDDVGPAARRLAPGRRDRLAGGPGRLAGGRPPRRSRRQRVHGPLARRRGGGRAAAARALQCRQRAASRWLPAMRSGLELRQMAEALRTVTPVPGRVQAVEEGQGFARARRLLAQARCAGEGAHVRARAGDRPRDRRVRGRRRPRPRQAPADGRDRGAARRRRDRHVRQPALRAAGGDHRRDLHRHPGRRRPRGARRRPPRRDRPAPSSSPSRATSW